MSSTRSVRKGRARRGLGRSMTVAQRQNLARRLVYFTLPALGMAGMALTFDGNRRVVSFLALLALVPAMLFLSRSRVEPVGPWVARRARRREIALLERLWASSPSGQS